MKAIHKKRNCRMGDEMKTEYQVQGPEKQVAHKLEKPLDGGRGVYLFRFNDASWAVNFRTREGNAEIITRLGLSDDAMKALIDAYNELHKKPIAWTMNLKWVVVSNGKKVTAAKKHTSKPPAKRAKRKPGSK